MFNGFKNQRLRVCVCVCNIHDLLSISKALSAAVWEGRSGNGRAVK